MIWAMPERKRLFSLMSSLISIQFHAKIFDTSFCRSNTSPFSRFATMYLDSNAETCLVRNVGMSLASNVKTFQDNNARTSPDSSAATFPSRNAQTFLARNVATFPANSASRCLNRCALPANQTTDDMFNNNKQQVPDFHTTETHDLTPIPMYLCIQLFDIYGILVNLEALEEINSTIKCGVSLCRGFPAAPVSHGSHL